MIREKASKIKLLLLDVDGVLTDGRITITDAGEEIKTFDVKDGFGIKALLAAGIEVALITGRKSQIVKYRADELGIDKVYQGITDKKSICKQLIKDMGLARHEVCSVGDDLPDMTMFSESGLRIAVADAAKEVCESADLTTKNKGGHGAVREVCELLLKSQKKWNVGAGACGK
jgi:3-deoxy-D-manno-octulosonate 8-phosphate phosphatase (KDO 8-P phosphatase)